MRLSNKGASRLLAESEIHVNVAVVLDLKSYEFRPEDFEDFPMQKINLSDPILFALIFEAVGWMEANGNKTLANAIKARFLKTDGD